MEFVVLRDGASLSCVKARVKLVVEGSGSRERSALLGVFRMMYGASIAVMSESEHQSRLSGRGEQRWFDGDVRLFGNEDPREVRVFAGLFRFEGFGMGHYFSSSGRVLFLGEAESLELAEREGVAFVGWSGGEREPASDMPGVWKVGPQEMRPPAG